MANDGSFKPGDVVQLKSGGPQMTVTHVDEDGALCEWFDKNQVVQARSFSTTALIAYRPPVAVPHGSTSQRF